MLFECVTPYDRAGGSGMSGTGQGQLPDDFLDLVDLYCSGLIDDEGFHRLESMLLDSPSRAASTSSRTFTTIPRSNSRSGRVVRPMRCSSSSRLVPARYEKAACGQPSDGVSRRWSRGWVGCGGRSRAPGGGNCGRSILAARSGRSGRSQPWPKSPPRAASPGWSTLRIADGPARSKSPAATCRPARSCGWSGGWPRSNLTRGRG